MSESADAALARGGPAALDPGVPVAPQRAGSAVADAGVVVGPGAPEAVDPSPLEQLRARGRLRHGLGLLGPAFVAPRVRRPGQLRHQHRRRLAVRLSAAVGDPRREPDGDADPVPVGEGRHRDGTQPARALP